MMRCTLAVAMCLLAGTAHADPRPRRTEVAIRGEGFLINGKPTYEGRTWKGKKVEGLLFNSRMVQGIFDDLNPKTAGQWAYPDTKKWDPERNSREFLAAMPDWRKQGLLAFTLNLQGGSPQGYSKDQPWHNSAIAPDGSLRPEYMACLERILDRADELGMVVILGIFYFGQDQRLKDEDAVKKAVDNAVDWVFDHGYRHVVIEVNNECNVRYDHDILKPDRVHELIERVKKRTRDGRRLLVSTSYGGGTVPKENVVAAADFLLLHGNGVGQPERIAEMVRQTRKVAGYRPKPILFNEDDHFDFEKPSNNMLAALGEYASWGYFDFRMKDEGFDEGYQSVPVNWGISSARKKGFFRLLDEVTQGGGGGAKAPAGPNVLMIIADDQGWGDYSFMGHPHIRTPHLDRLAASSLTFRRGYVPSSLCRPSLATMITGLYPHQHRITSNDPPLPKGKTGRAAQEDPTFLAQREEMIKYIDKVPTLPRLLGDRGHVSFQSGKWWEGDHCRCGFTEGMTHGDPKKGGRHGDTGLKIGREGIKEVTDFIDGAAAKKKPFYVWYAPLMPHSPHNPPARLLDKYKEKTESIHVARYWAMCEWFDETVGELLGHLDGKGLTRDTIVVYVCDNGWIQDEKSPQYAPRSKRSPYDGGLRTPIMIRWPGKVKPRERDELAGSLDLAPTLLTAVGLGPTRDMQGINLLDEAAVKGRTALYGEVFEHNAVDVHRPAANLQYRWVIDGSMKLILPAASVKEGRVELFDLARDPHERENLAGKQPETVARLRRMLDTWWAAKD